MPKAASRLELLQICKLLQCVREKNKEQVEKLTISGVPHLINYNDPNEGNTALGVAAIGNDEDMIEFLLEVGAHPDVMDLNGRTAAMRAAEFGHVHCLQKLLDADADLTLTDLNGKGVIFHTIASTERHAKCLEMVLNHGANVNNVAADNTPVFVFACDTAADNEQMCITLLERGADPNLRIEPPPPPADGIKRALKIGKERQMRFGRTALMSASNSGSDEVVRAILSKAADVNMLDSRKNHAVHFAAKGGHIKCLMCMSGFGAQFNITNVDGNSPIHLAAIGGHAMCCKYMSQRGCNPKPKNNEGMTARAITKDAGQKVAMKELRKAEKSFGKVGKNNEPWALAFYDWVVQNEDDIWNKLKQAEPNETGNLGRMEFCDAILGMGAPVSEDCLKKLAAMHSKTRDSAVEIKEFISAKKWINKNFLVSAFEGKKKKKKKGRKGSKKGKFRLVMPICTHEDEKRNESGGPLEPYIPQHVHFTDTVRFDRDNPPRHPLQDDSAWYMKHPNKSYVSINEASKLGDFDSLKLALQKGISIDTRDRFYKTPIMMAAAAGHIDMVKYLVDNGALVNVRDNFKWTALHHACHAGQLDVVQYLVEKGGEINATTLNGGTPLTRAIESSRDAVVRYLIGCGVKVQTENRKGMTPMEIAESWADPRVLEIVREKWDALPPIDKKKAAKGKGKKIGGTKGKRPTTAPGQNGILQATSKQDEDNMASLCRKGSILRAASALAGDMEETENIAYTPLKAWTNQDTTEQLVQERGVKRERFGWQVDFADFEMPFKKNVSTMLDKMDDNE